MVPHHLERTGNVPEYPLSVVRVTRSLAVHQPARAHDFPAVRFADGLVPETNAKDRNRLSPAPYRRNADSSFRWRAGSRRDDHARHAQPSNVVDTDLVVALHDGILAELAQILNEIVGEGVVVIEDEEH